MPIRTGEHTIISQRVSVGVAAWNREENAAQLVHRAEAALARAKEAGRNRTEVASGVGRRSSLRM